jgi:DNA-directed RNA polymerase subunit RPC12/RpoP
MGREWITRYELPETIRCPNCGSSHVMIYGTRVMEYEEEEKDGDVIDSTYVDVKEDVITGVECLECGEAAELDEISKWDGAR